MKRIKRLLVLQHLEIEGPGLFEKFAKEKAIRNNINSGALESDLFKCTRCKKNHCSYYELQTRSADEATTVFITCLNCGKRWRS